MTTLRIHLREKIHHLLPPVDPASTEEPQYGSLVWGGAGGLDAEDPRRAGLCAEWTTDGRIRASVYAQSGVGVRLGRQDAAVLRPGPDGWIRWIPEPGTFWVLFPEHPEKGWEPLTLRVVV